MLSFCLKGVLDLVPKQGPKASGIRLGTLSQIGIRLLAISSQELGLKARQKMDYGFGVFGTIHIAVSGSTVSLQLEFDVTEMGDLVQIKAVQIKADLRGALWQNVFGSSLTVHETLITHLHVLIFYDSSAMCYSPPCSMLEPWLVHTSSI
jgi:hypothetical protein